MKRKCHLILWLLPLMLIFITEKLSAQQRVAGKVISEASQKPLANVNVMIKGDTKGVVTDVRGRYSINVPDSNAVLVFTYIGF